MKHTPGPWETQLWKLGEAKTAQIVVNGKSDCVAFIKPLFHHVEEAPRGGEMEANARLIAAAPELLAALKILEVGCSEASLRHHQKSGTTDKLAETLLQIIREAVEKAEGGA